MPQQYSDLPPGAVVYSDLPPGATLADSAPAPIATQGTISAAPAPSFGTQLEQDLREGGTRTAVGRFLGRMQGRGDQGFTGLESGVSPGVANYVGSPELGAATMVQGAQQLPQHPISGALTIGRGALQAATLPSVFMGGPIAEAGANAIPSRSAAADALNMIEQRAANQPVPLTRSADALQRLAELGARGGQMPNAANQLLNRSQAIVPMNFPEGRDFYSNISRLSGEEANRMTPTVARAMGNLKAALHGDLTDAAEGVGLGQPYSNAVREYAQASQMSKTAKTVAKYLAGAAGAGAAYKLFGDFTNPSGH